MHLGQKENISIHEMFIKSTDKNVCNSREYSYENDIRLGTLWAEYKKQSSMGTEVEFGLMFRMGRISLSAGINSISFSFLETNGNIGSFF